MKGLPESQSTKKPTSADWTWETITSFQTGKEQRGQEGDKPVNEKGGVRRKFAPCGVRKNLVEAKKTPQKDNKI